MSPAVLYLLAAAYTAAAGYAYAQRHAVDDRDAGGADLGAAALCVVAGLAWFIAVPLALIAYLSQLWPFAAATITSAPPEAPAKPTVRLVRDQLAVLRTRHVSPRPARLKEAAAPTDARAATGETAEEADPSVKVDRAHCPACETDVPTNGEGFLMAHYPVSGDKVAYCRGSRTKPARRS